MLLKLFQFGEPADAEPARISCDRLEVPIIGPDEREWMVMLADHDDTFDVIIQDPLGSREAVWTLIKDGDAADREEEEEEEEDED